MNDWLVILRVGPYRTRVIVTVPATDSEDAVRQASEPVRLLPAIACVVEQCTELQKDGNVAAPVE